MGLTFSKLQAAEYLIPTTVILRFASKEQVSRLSRSGSIEVEGRQETEAEGGRSH